jgi:hypothetical protein
VPECEEHNHIHEKDGPPNKLAKNLSTKETNKRRKQQLTRWNNVKDQVDKIMKEEYYD